LESPPGYEADTTSYERQQEKFTEQAPQAQDKLWAVVFVLHFLTMIGLSVYYAVKADPTEGDKQSFSYNITRNIAYILAIQFLSALVIASMWIVVVKTFASCLIWTSLLLGVVSTGVLAVLMFFTGNIVFGIIMLVIFFLNCLYVYYVRHRIPFAVALLEVSVEILNRWSSTIYNAFLFMLINILWIIIWSVGATFVLREFSGNGASGGAAVEIFLIFSFYWTSAVISAVVLMTTAGVLAEWYFKYPDNMQPSPTWRSLKRATTTSFGSICFGSFLIAAIRTLKALVRQARRSDNGILLCIAQCILNCIESIMDYFNYYAYVYCAIYGTDYCSSGKAVWNLFCQRGFDVIINDDLIGGALSLGGLFAGAVTAIISYFAAVAFSVTSESRIAVVALGFIIGIVFTFTALSVVQAAVSALLVCFCEDPATLYNTKPESYRKIINPMKERYGNIAFVASQR